VTEELDTKIEIELLKKDVVTMSALLTKFDAALDKMQEIASSLSRMVSLQEQRLEVQETSTKELQSVLEMRRIEHNSEIKELHSRITTVNRELSDKIDDTEKKILDEIQSLKIELKGDNKGIGTRLSQIEAWKYGVAAVIAALLFLATKNAINISKLFGI
jgi:archaellum component FlaC